MSEYLLNNKGGSGGGVNSDTYDGALYAWGSNAFDLNVHTYIPIEYVRQYKKIKVTPVVGASPSTIKLQSRNDLSTGQATDIISQMQSNTEYVIDLKNVSDAYITVLVFVNNGTVQYSFYN